MADNQILTFIDEARRELAYSQTFEREAPSDFAHRHERCAWSAGASPWAPWHEAVDLWSAPGDRQGAKGASP